jgi:hypothetical protein
MMSGGGQGNGSSQLRKSSLHKMSDRIRARAIRRCGELIKEFEFKQGARTDFIPKATRSSIARDAGLSEGQKKPSRIYACYQCNPSTDKISHT